MDAQIIVELVVAVIAQKTVKRVVVDVLLAVTAALVIVVQVVKGVVLDVVILAQAVTLIVVEHVVPDVKPIVAEIAV